MQKAYQAPQKVASIINFILNLQFDSKFSGVNNYHKSHPDYPARNRRPGPRPYYDRPAALKTELDNKNPENGNNKRQGGE